MVEIRGGVGRPWWAKVASAMWPSTVVVANVFREHHTQVSLAEDQHTVGEFGSEGAYESFGEAVRSWAAWRNLDHGDAGVGEDGVE
jgi:hypothetical protein